MNNTRLRSCIKTNGRTVVSRIYNRLAAFGAQQAFLLDTVRCAAFKVGIAPLKSAALCNTFLR